MARRWLCIIGAMLITPLATPVLADESLDAANAEMNKMFGRPLPFITLMPEGARAGAWEYWKGSSGNPNGQIPPKYRELISLGVAAQIPCAYCAYAHTAFAKANGATDEEVREAIDYGAEVRLWSTVLNGSQYDLDTWKADIDSILAHVAAQSKK